MSRARKGFGVATAVNKQGVAVANFLARDRIGFRRRPAGIFRSTVGVEIEFRAMPLKRAQSLVATDQSEGSVGMNRDIGELSGAVTAYSAASEAMQTKNNVLVVEVPAGIGAKASTVFRGVIGSQERWRPR